MGTDATRVLPEPVVLILILDPSVHTGASHRDLHELYRFTVAETELANFLMTGKSLRDCSHELGISYSTARTHLDNVFKKTGVRHQAHLVSLLLRSIGLLRPARS
jgi:DNA-binding CsgD family transcriptional regulator